MTTIRQRPDHATKTGCCASIRPPAAALPSPRVAAEARRPLGHPKLASLVRLLAAVDHFPAIQSIPCSTRNRPSATKQFALWPAKLLSLSYEAYPRPPVLCSYPLTASIRC